MFTRSWRLIGLKIVQHSREILIIVRYRTGAGRSPIKSHPEKTAISTYAYLIQIKCLYRSYVFCFSKDAQYQGLGRNEKCKMCNCLEIYCLEMFIILQMSSITLCVRQITFFKFSLKKIQNFAQTN